MRCELTVLVAAVYVGVALGQNDILKEKWGLVFDYLNLVKEADVSDDVLDFSDYQAMKKKLEASKFEPVADDLLKLSYSAGMRDGTEYETRRRVMDTMASNWWAGIHKTTRLYDMMYDVITKVTGSPLTRQGFEDFEVAVGVMDAVSAGVTFEKMMALVGKGDVLALTKTEYRKAYVMNYDNDTVSACDLPLFGLAP